MLCHGIQVVNFAIARSSSYYIGTQATGPSTQEPRYYYSQTESPSTTLNFMNQPTEAILTGEESTGDVSSDQMTSHLTATQRSTQKKLLPLKKQNHTENSLSVVQ